MFRPLARLAWHRLQRPVVVLCYHGLRGPDDPSSWLRVELEVFREQVALLSTIGRFVGVDSLTGDGDGLRFLLTFDDGYQDNLAALSVLKEVQASALFFVSTYHVLTGEPFWFDRVVAPIQSSGLEVLDLRAAGLRMYHFHREDGEKRWSGIQRLLTDIKRMGNPGSPAVDRILLQVQSIVPDCLPPPLSPSDLHVMASSGLCQFGSHGHRHVIMTRCPAAQLREEFQTSRRLLEDWVGRPVTDAAYPNGDTDVNVEAACRAAGFERTFSTRPGVWQVTSSSYSIPRLLVGGYDSPHRLLWRVGRLLFLAILRDAEGRH